MLVVLYENECKMDEIRLTGYLGGNTSIISMKITGGQYEPNYLADKKV